ncbi:MAG: GIY-YIG nuclease family protein [Gammaproteobacteria bacterium]|nr:GIY-YIG nuclease family protein [Gammaproteobacteria bacterium]
MSIKLSEILTFENPSEYKVHLANWNGSNQPLDIFVSDKERWKGWNSWRGENDDFNRRYIFSLIDFYHEPNVWLFGGVYEVTKRLNVTRDKGYEVELTDQFSPFIGRLKIRWARSGRAKSRRLENYVDEYEVSEILKEEYTGEAFCGYEHINHDFHVLEAIFLSAKPDWKAALENVKGVYLIMDKHNGKKYVGSAYGGAGIWSRWSCYMGNGHGHNDELTKLIKKRGMEYARQNFRFSLLEYRPMKTDDAEILARESYWKEALLSRGEFGYNAN